MLLQPPPYIDREARSSVGLPICPAIASRLVIIH